MTTQTQTAIDRSITHNEIVHVAFDDDVIADLSIACEDSVGGNTETEFWGTDGDGDEWRVHVRHAA